MHIVNVPGTPPTTQTLPHPFNGRLDGNLSRDVYIGGNAAATVGSTATNSPPHTPTAPGTTFVNLPSNSGRVTSGSRTVFINGKAAVRGGDSAQTCADPVPNTGSTVSARGNVYFG